MIKTPDLIASLAASATPVRRLRPPVMRAACWLLLAAVILTLLAINHGIRPDLVWRLQEPAFVVGVAAAALTGVLAAVAAFLVSLPDRPRLWLLLPMPSLILWLSNVGYQCLTQWVAVGPDGMSSGEAARCFPTLELTGFRLSLAMLVMLRYAALLRPTGATFMGRRRDHGDRAVDIPHHRCDNDDPDMELRYGGAACWARWRVRSKDVPMGRAANALRKGPRSLAQSHELRDCVPLAT